MMCDNIVMALFKAASATFFSASFFVLPEPDPVKRSSIQTLALNPSDSSTTVYFISYHFFHLREKGNQPSLPIMTHFDNACLKLLIKSESSGGITAENISLFLSAVITVIFPGATVPVTA